MFMVASEENPGTLPEPACTVQIDTTLHRSESRARHGFQRFSPAFNRTLLDKYFKARASRNWVFTATEEQEDGTKSERILLRESDTPIHRHIKIQADANPRDSQWAQYFESRWGKKMLHSARGRRKLYRVWRRQDGMCSTCQQPITKSTPWAARHIVKRTEGGSDAASNLSML
ncbi:MAG: hypothetical protein ACR2HE_11945, partial [Casimicrobiaceae bacterium]